MPGGGEHAYHNRRWDEYARKSRYGAGEHETGLMDWIPRAVDYLVKEIEVQHRLHAEMWGGGTDGGTGG